jgi:hypothetical protein
MVVNIVVPTCGSFEIIGIMCGKNSKNALAIWQVKKIKPIFNPANHGSDKLFTLVP